MTGSIHKTVSKNVDKNANRVVEARCATEFQRRKRILKERTLILGFTELEFSLPCTRIEKQRCHFRQEGKQNHTGKIIHDFSERQ